MIGLGAVVAMDRMLGDNRLNLFGDVFDGSRTLVRTALQRPATTGAAFQVVLSAGINPLGSLSSMAGMTFPGTGLLTPLGYIRLRINRHHARRRRRRWLLPVPPSFQLGNALARSQKCQDDDFGIVLAESQRLRFADLTAHRSVDERADGSRLPWLYVGLHTSAKASAQIYLS